MSSQNNQSGDPSVAEDSAAEIARNIKKMQEMFSDIAATWHPSASDPFNLGAAGAAWMEALSRNPDKMIEAGMKYCGFSGSELQMLDCVFPISRFAQNFTIALRYLVGTDDQGVGECRNHGPSFFQCQASDKVIGGFTILRGLIDVRRDVLEFKPCSFKNPPPIWRR